MAATTRLPATNEAPFADGRPFTNHQPLLGGEVFVIPGPLAANANIVQTHFLSKIPRGLTIWDSGATPTPKWWRGAAWTHNTVTIQIDTPIPGGTNLVGLLL